MAQFRMIGKTVIQTQKFLRLPLETQAVYFHLMLNADDEGVVEAFPVIRMIGAREDSLDELADKKFINLLNDELVYFIVDFGEQNTIRRDRIKPSRYRDLISMPQDLISMPQDLISMPNLSAQSRVDKSRVDKSRVDKSRVEHSNQKIERPSLDQIESVSETETLRKAEIKQKFIAYSELYPKKTKKREAYEAFKQLTDDEIKRLMTGTQNLATELKYDKQDFKFLKNQATFITDEAYLDYQTAKTTAPVGSKTPEWSEPDYKNETSAEELAQLEKIRLDALAKISEVKT
ncbi:hypothetical protein [Pseudolactococcus insecticola]|uniref:Replisome organizer n=1 Tax=Pseudolactococcus insecticola TaxID=2709158 RepID=A0A6A0B3B3_9LACT|nr:hypothetical protein [Lactococcus insecticola]GFH39829.1 hypothetical protein Hs20B_02270 [Lactococcus insecticola]